MSDVILKAKNLCKYFYGYQRNLFTFTLNPTNTVTIKAVDRVNIEVKKGQIVAIVGESGSGKTTLGYTLAGIYRPTAGEIWFDGEEISKSDLKKIRRNMQIIFQDPGSSLNPRQTIESIVSLPLRIYLNLSSTELKRRIIELLDLVNLPSSEIMLRYPSNLSGGEKQRIGIARALALNPKVIILDEPTSSLDVSVQAKVLKLLKNLHNNLQISYLFITHNLIIAKDLAEQINVMYLGRILEKGTTEIIFKNPLHPYTKALLSAIPVINKKEKRLIPEEIILEGELPSNIDIPNYCSFFSRCPVKSLYCKNSPEPALKEVEDDHWVRCLLY